MMQNHTTMQEEESIMGEHVREASGSSSPSSPLNHSHSHTDNNHPAQDAPESAHAPILMTTTASSSGNNLAAIASGFGHGHRQPSHLNIKPRSTRYSSSTSASASASASRGRLSPRFPTDAVPWTPGKASWTRKTSDWQPSQGLAGPPASRQQNGQERNFSSALMSHKTQFPASSRYFLTVVPPDDFPCEPPHPRSVSGSSSYSHMRRGALLPLYPTLNGQLYAISREYGLPSIGGLAIYLCEDADGNLGPKIGEQTWQVLWSKYFANDDEDTSGMDTSGHSMPKTPMSPFPGRPQSRAAREPSAGMSFDHYRSPDPEAYPDGRRTPSGNASYLSGHVRRPTGGSASHRGSPALGPADLDGSFYSGRPSSRMSSALPIIGRVEWTVEKHKAPWWKSWIGEVDASSHAKSHPESVVPFKNRTNHNKKKSLQLFKRIGSTSESGGGVEDINGANRGNRSSSASRDTSSGSLAQSKQAYEQYHSPGQSDAISQRQSRNIANMQTRINSSSSVQAYNPAVAEQVANTSGSQVKQTRFSGSSGRRRSAVEAPYQGETQRPDPEVSLQTPSASSSQKSSASLSASKSPDNRTPRQLPPQANRNSIAAETSSFAGYSALLDDDEVPHRPASNRSNVRDGNSERRQSRRSGLPSEYSRYSSSQHHGTLDLIPDSDESMWRALRDAPEPPVAPGGFALSHERLSSHQSEEPTSHYSGSFHADPKDHVSQWIRRTQHSPDLMRRRSALVQENIPDHIEQGDDQGHQLSNFDEADEEEEEEALLPPQDDVREVVQLWAEKAVTSSASGTPQLGSGSLRVRENDRESTLATPVQTPQTKLLSPIALGDGGMFEGPAPQLGSLALTARDQTDEDDFEDESNHDGTSGSASRELLSTNDDRIGGLSSVNTSLQPPRSPGEISAKSSSTDISGLEDFERALELLSPVASNHANSPSLAYLSRRPDGTRMSSRDSLAAAKSLSTSVTPSPRWLAKNRAPRSGLNGFVSNESALLDGRPKSTSAAEHSIHAQLEQWPPASSGRLADQVIKALSPAPAPTGDIHPSPLRTMVQASAASSDVSASPAANGYGQTEGHERQGSGIAATHDGVYHVGRRLDAHKDFSRQMAQDALTGQSGTSHLAQPDAAAQVKGNALGEAWEHVDTESLKDDDVSKRGMSESKSGDSVIIHAPPELATREESASYPESLGESEFSHDSVVDGEEERLIAQRSEAGSQHESVSRESTGQRPVIQDAESRQSVASTSISDAIFWRHPSSEENRSEDIAIPSSEISGHLASSSPPNAPSTADLPLYGFNLTPDHSSPLATPRPDDGMSGRGTLGASNPYPARSAAALASVTGTGSFDSGSSTSPDDRSEEAAPSIARLIRGQSFSASSVAPSSAAATPNAGHAVTFDSVLPHLNFGEMGDTTDHTVRAGGDDYDDAAHGQNMASLGYDEGNVVPPSSSWASSEAQPRQDETSGSEDNDAGDVEYHTQDDVEEQESHETPIAQYPKESAAVAPQQLATEAPSSSDHYGNPSSNHEDDNQSESEVWSQDGSRFSRYSRFEDRQSVLDTRSASNSAVSRFEDSGPETPTFFFDQQLTDSRPNSYRVSKRYSNGASLQPRSPLAAPPAPASLASDGDGVGLGFLPSKPSDSDLNAAKRHSESTDTLTPADKSHEGGRQVVQSRSLSTHKDVSDELDAMLSSIDAFNHIEKSRPWSRPTSRASSSRKFGEQQHSLTLPDLQAAQRHGHSASKDDLESMTLSTKEAVRQALTGSERMGLEQVPSRLSLSSTKSLGNMGSFANRRSQSPRRPSSSSARYSTSAMRRTSEDSGRAGSSEERSLPPRANSLSAASTISAMSPRGRFKALPPSPSLLPRSLTSRTGEPMSPLSATFLAAEDPVPVPHGRGSMGGNGNVFQNHDGTLRSQSPRMMGSPTLVSSPLTRSSTTMDLPGISATGPAATMSTSTSADVLSHWA
ncbi:unnamed protein product [Sympodiomycopsis kandeliae]